MYQKTIQLIRKTIISFVSLLSITLCCSDKNQDPITDTPEPATIFSGDIPSGGGTITVTSSSSSLKGMTVTIPPAAAGIGQHISIDTLPVDNKENSSCFAPASPVIKIYGPSRADSSLYEITVPVQNVKNQVVMGFMCDNAGEIIEALPFTDRTDTSITFAVASLSGASAGLLQKRASVDPFSFIVKTITVETLSNKAVISSGFKPGVDDWEFVNYGSYISPGGHCAGQSLSAMWYYYEKKLKGARSLFHAFDSINISREKIWQDNPQGFRAASMVQNDIPFEGMMFNFFKNGQKSKDYDIYTFQAFAAAILATGEPQYVSIRSKKGGHAIVAYKVSIPEKKIFIADPNFPAEERFLTLVNDTFLPYASKQNAADVDSNSYTKFAYIAKSALIDWPQIGKRMNEMASGTAGNGVFPSYSLQVAEGSGYPLTDGFSTDKDSLLFEAICPTCQKSYPGGRQFVEVFNAAGELLAQSKGLNAGPVDGQVLTVLAPGKNRLGITVWGWRPLNDTTMRRYYIDFKWITVSYNALAVNPELSRGDLDSIYTFTIRQQGTSSSNRSFEWNFGDGSSSVTSSDTIIKHTFSKSGTFSITVSMKDRSTSKVTAQGKATAIITGGAPVVDSISPDSAHALDTLKIYGHNFGEKGVSSIVAYSIYDTTDTYISWTDSVITAIVPENAQTGWFNVYINDESSSSIIFTRLFDKPVITSVEPTRVYAGDTVTIHGKHFRQKRSLNDPFTSVLFPVGSNSAISGTLWGDSLYVWSDTIVKTRATGSIIGGGLRIVSEKDTSTPFPIIVGYRIGRIVNATVGADVEAKIQTTYDSSVTNSSKSMFEVAAQYPQSQNVSGTTISAVYDTVYETGGSMNTRVHKRREVTMVIDFDNGILNTMSGESTDEYTNVQSGTGTITKSTIKGGPLPLNASNGSSRITDTLSSIGFWVKGDSVCTRIQTLTSTSTSTNTYLASYSCSAANMSQLSAYIQYVRLKQ